MLNEDERDTYRDKDVREGKLHPWREQGVIAVEPSNNMTQLGQYLLGDERSKSLIKWQSSMYEFPYSFQAAY